MTEEKTSFGLDKSEFRKLFDVLNKYASGVQPSEVANEFRDMTDEKRQAIAPLALIAAIGARRTIEQDPVIQAYLQKVQIARSILLESFTLANKVNFTKLYMLGNLLMESTSFDDVPAIKNYQAKIKGKSLLTADASSANLSDKKKEIIRSQLGKYDINLFKQAALLVNTALSKEMVTTMLYSTAVASSSASSSSHYRVPSKSPVTSPGK
jgi:hypothetical protein